MELPESKVQRKMNTLVIYCDPNGKSLNVTKGLGEAFIKKNYNIFWTNMSHVTLFLGFPLSHHLTGLDLKLNTFVMITTHCKKREVYGRPAPATAPEIV